MLRVTGDGVQIGIPITGDIGDEIFYSILTMAKPKGTKLTKVKFFSIDIARNKIVDKLEKEWLFFMDADQAFHPETLMRLLSWNVPIVSGLYFVREGTPRPHCYEYAGGKNGHHTYRTKAREVHDYLIKHKDKFGDGNPVVLLPKESLIECDGIAGGCLLVHRRVFEAIKKPYFKCIKNAANGEDFYFCRKAQGAGFKIFVDPGVLCGHIQTGLVGYRHFLNWITSPELEFPYPWELITPGGKK